MFQLQETYNEPTSTLILPTVSNSDDNALLGLMAAMLGQHFSQVKRVAARPLYFLRDNFFLSSGGSYLFNNVAENIPGKVTDTDPDFPDLTPIPIIFKNRYKIQNKLIAQSEFFKDTMPDMIQTKEITYDISHGQISPYYTKNGNDFLRQISPASALKLLPISGGNIIPLTKSDGTQIIIIGVNSEILWQAARTQQPTLPTLDSYLSALGWQKDKNLFFIPQSSYHIDLNIAAPKPGVVIVNTYESLLKDDSVMRSLLDKIKIRFPAAYPRLPSIEYQKYIFKHQQRCLDTVATFLQTQGFTVIRALGHLGFAGYQDGPVRSAKVEALNVFNFINSIPKRCADGQYEFIGLGTYRIFKSFQDDFRTALAKENITCHFLSDNDPSGQMAGVYHDLGAGLRSFTAQADRVSVPSAA